MTHRLESFLESRVEYYSERGHDYEALTENQERLKQRLNQTSSKVALVTNTPAGVGGFVKVGERQSYHLSAALIDSALISGQTRDAEKVADHETAHLESAQDIDFSSVGFDETDAHFLAQEYQLNLKAGEPILAALSRYLIEGLTEAKSQQRKWADPKCAYTQDEVPATVKLVFAIQKHTKRNLFREFNQRGEAAMAETLKLFVGKMRLAKMRANDNFQTVSVAA